MLPYKEKQSLEEIEEAVLKIKQEISLEYIRSLYDGWDETLKICIACHGWYTGK